MKSHDEGLTSEQPLLDCGEMRLYGNRIEMDQKSIFGRVKRVDVVFYSDITSARAKKKELFFTRTGMKTNVILNFKDKKSAASAYEIIMSHKQ
jgi:hypothetical protein